MVGGNMRRDEGFTINSTNVFSALESLRKKKKSDKSKGSSKAAAQEAEPQVFWAPAPLTAKSWADVDDEDDDDYYATTAPPQALWGSQESQQSKEPLAAVELRESESEDDMLDLGDEDVEEEHEHEKEVMHAEPVAEKVPEAPLPAKETERQLSKKERKKKELEELEALLADFGVTQNDLDGQSIAQERKEAELKKGETVDNEDKKDAAPSESKNAKKKKNKSSKEAKETLDQPKGLDVNDEPNEPTGTEQADEDSSAIDVKERLKKVAAAKKKKSGKELDGATKAAALEAAARSARLAASRKERKEPLQPATCLVRVLLSFAGLLKN